MMFKEWRRRCPPDGGHASFHSRTPHTAIACLVSFSRYRVIDGEPVMQAINIREGNADSVKRLEHNEAAAPRGQREQFLDENELIGKWFGGALRVLMVTKL